MPGVDGFLYPNQVELQWSVLIVLYPFITGLVAGVFIAIPSLFESKPLTILLFAAAGVMGGLLRDLAPDKEFIWKFTPDLSP